MLPRGERLRAPPQVAHFEILRCAQDLKMRRNGAGREAATDSSRSLREAPNEAREAPKEAREAPKEARMALKEAREAPREARMAPKEAREAPRKRREGGWVDALRSEREREAAWPDDEWRGQRRWLVYGRSGQASATAKPGTLACQPLGVCREQVAQLPGNEALRRFCRHATWRRDAMLRGDASAPPGRLLCHRPMCVAPPARRAATSRPSADRGRRPGVARPRLRGSWRR
ncbi:MAG: hypothetical protein JWN02_413 [Acidobacteria bacterium]|nr:hypothetical protein [Acidobacteriota bacterium]